MQKMLTLLESLEAWGAPGFDRVLKSELEAMQQGVLPLQKCTSQGGMVDDSNVSVTVIRSVEQEEHILADVGVFFEEIVGGCSCGDEPYSDNAYCLMQVSIDKSTAEAVFNLL